MNKLEADELLRTLPEVDLFGSYLRGTVNVYKPDGTHMAELTDFDEAVEYVQKRAHYIDNLPEVGDRVQALYPNERVGQGTVIAVVHERTRKPLVVELDDGGRTAFFHWDQVAKV